MTKNKIMIAITAIAFVSLVTLPVLAKDDKSKDCLADSTSTDCLKKEKKDVVKMEDKLNKAQTKADNEVDKRIEKLNKLISRIQEFKNIQDSQKSAIVATIQALIAHMAALKNEIDTATSTTVVKNDMKMIAQDYRIYALAIPQLNVVAASDRIMTIVNMMSIVGTKLQTRLVAETGISNTTALQAYLTDFVAKITDAKTQAQTAFNLVSPLMPDAGDKVKMAANTATLKDARAKIKAAKADLEAARKDAQMIIKALVKADKDILKNADIPKHVASTTNATTTGTTTQ